MPFWFSHQQPDDFSPHDSPLAILVAAGGVDLLREEARRAGLKALAKHAMIRRARVGALRAHETAGQDMAILSAQLAAVAGLLALAKSSEACIAAGWCHRVLRDTRWKVTHLAADVDWRTRKLLIADVTRHSPDRLKRPEEKVLAAAIMTGELLHHAEQNQPAECLAPSLDALLCLNARGCTPLRHLIAVARELHDIMMRQLPVSESAVVKEAASSSLLTSLQPSHALS